MERGRGRRLTLGVEEVADGHEMVALLVMDGGFSEDLIDMCLRADAHVLLAESLCVVANAGGFLSSMSICK